MEVILKFFDNEAQGPDNILVSRTLGKIAMIARDRRGAKYPQPKPHEFWRCRILKETNRGKRAGCFLVEPIEQVPADKLLKLLPGMYVSEVVNGQLIVTPTLDYRGKPCILPLEHKHVFSQRNETYCTLVDVSALLSVQKKVEPPTVPKKNPYAR